MKTRIFLYVQHLLGIGHLRRAAILARGMARNGFFDVLVVSGGAPIDDLDLGEARLHQLPPLRARDEGLRELALLDGSQPSGEFYANRTAELLAVFRREQPDVVITEQFPFGRTRLRFELEPLLKAARAMPKRPLIVSSVRDVVRSTATAERIRQTCETIREYGYFVLVHGDPKIVPFECSFAAAPDIKDRWRYTGYIAESDLTPAGTQGTGEVIVSVGGGAVGAPLLRAALEARQLTSLKDSTWRLLLGANASADEMTALRSCAPAGVIIEPARNDFVTLLANARLSISQAGYNTAIETLACGDRAVFVPFVTARETEQLIRAEAIARRCSVQMVPGDKLTAATLAAAIERAMKAPSIRSFPRPDVDGVVRTISTIAQTFR